MADAPVGDLPEDVRIIEILPRDGFQSMEEFVPTERKVEIVGVRRTPAGNRSLRRLGVWYRGGVVLLDVLKGVGNIPTEDLLHLLSRTGVCSTDRFESVAGLAREIAEEFDVGRNSHVVRGGTTDTVLDVMNWDR